MKEDVYIYDNDYNKENILTEIVLKDNINIFTNGDKPIGVLKVSISDYEKTYDITTNIFNIIVKNLYIYLIALFLILFIIVVIIFLIVKIGRPKKNKRIWG